MKGRRRTEDERRQDRGTRREEQHGSVDLHALESGQATRPHGYEDANAPPRKEEAQQGAGRGQHTTLRQHLPDDPATPAPQCGPHRDLPAPGGRTHQQQVRNVAAGDEQHEARGDQQGEEHRTSVVHHVSMHRVHNDVHVRVGVVLILLSQPQRQRVHLLLYPLRCDTRLQAGHYREPPRVTGKVRCQIARDDAPCVDIRGHAGIRR